MTVVYRNGVHDICIPGTILHVETFLYKHFDLIFF